MKKLYWIAIIGTLLILMLSVTGMVFFVLSSPAFAIDEPSSAPTVENVYCFQNVLEPSDFLAIIYENTPYSITPNVSYSDAFVWRFIDTDGSTEIDQASSYDYHDRGCGYNIISFYFNAASAPTWGQAYYLRLSGSPAHFATPPQYSFNIVAADYSSLTDQDEVQAAITETVLDLAFRIGNEWGLSATESLLTETEVGTSLSLYGQAFFRGAIYGLQAMAPDAFPLVLTDVTTETRTWNTTYINQLEGQYSGTYIESGVQAGEDFFDVDYNLMGILGIFLIVGALVATNWAVAGGNLWRGLIEGASPLIIGARLAMIGLGEVALIAAICWLYTSAKIWKVI